MKKLPANVLLSVLIISLLIALVLSSLISFAHISKVLLLKAELKRTAMHNVQSGIELLFTTPEQIPLNKVTAVDLFDTGSDKVDLLRQQWGCFELGTAKACYESNCYEQTILIGQKNTNQYLALTLVDKDKPLSLCGKTIIKGECYLPKAGVKRAYIEGQNFVGNKLIEGKINKSDRKLPPLKQQWVTNNLAYLVNTFSKNDSLVDFEKLVEVDTIKHPFSKKTLVIYSEDIIELEHRYYQGNIRVVSEKSIVVDANNQLEDIIVYAPVVALDDRFKGTLQIFATDSIGVGAHSVLGYPSICSILPKAGRKGKLHIGEKAVVRGGVYCLTKGENSDYSILNMKRNATVYGEVYAQGTVDFKGKVYGALSCNQFLLATPSSVYENHLLNAEIDPTLLSADFIGGDTHPENTKRDIVKWLN